MLTNQYAQLDTRILELLKESPRSYTRLVEAVKDLASGACLSEKGRWLPRRIVGTRLAYLKAHGRVESRAERVGRRTVRKWHLTEPA